MVLRPVPRCPSTAGFHATGELPALSLVMAVADQLFEQALALSEADRRTLTLRLLRSFHDLEDHEPPWSDAQWHAAWDETLRHRLQSIADGTAELVDGDVVLNELDALASSPLP
jgi:hypothetical protein